MDANPEIAKAQLTIKRTIVPQIKIYTYLQGEKMRFYCCGLVYSTEDPETYWCIETYNLKAPVYRAVNGVKVFKEVVYTLFCKKNGCSKLELHSYSNENGVLKLLQKQCFKGKKAQAFLERTQNMRIRKVQCCPLKAVNHSKNIPWVYGKAINSETQVVRYMDESGNREVFKGRSWQAEIIKAEIKKYNV